MGTSYTALTGESVLITIYSYSNDNVIQLSGDIQSFSDNFTANVNSEPTYGRIDPIKTYSGTTREISFGVLIDSTTQNNTYFDEITGLAAMMYPVYSNSTNKPYILKSPPLFAVNIPAILVGGTEVTVDKNELKGLLPGYFTSFGISYDTAKGVEVTTVKSVPREITLNFSFSPLHDRMGGFTEENTSRTTAWPF